MLLDDIQAELFRRVSLAPGLVTSSRILAHWSKVPPEEQPAAYQNHVSYTPTIKGRGVPPTWATSCEIWIYAQRDPITGGASTLLPLIDHVIQQLAPDDIRTNTCTLGGLALDCRVDGPIKTDEGVLGEQAVARITVTIYTA